MLRYTASSKINNKPLTDTKYDFSIIVEKMEKLHYSIFGLKKKNKGKKRLLASIDFSFDLRLNLSDGKVTWMHYSIFGLKKKNKAKKRLLASIDFEIKS